LFATFLYLFFFGLSWGGMKKNVTQGAVMKDKVSKINKKHIFALILVGFAVFSFLMTNWDQSL